MKKYLILVLALAMVFTISCKKKPEVVVETPAEPVIETPVETKVEAPKPVETKEPEAPKVTTHPLFNDRRPIAFMINNHPEAQPQSGWSISKIAYEILVEGQMTRILMISDAERGVVGPIRSARPAFFEIAAEYRPLYSHVGNFEYVQESPMLNYLVDFDQFYHGGYYRTSHRYAPHNLYGNMEDIYDAAVAEGVSLDLPDGGLHHFEVYDTERVFTGGTPASEISFTYDGAQYLNYRYDAEKEAYIKSINGVDVIDETTGELLEIKNFIIIDRPHGKMPNGVHEYVDYSVDGTARYFVQGQEFLLDYTKPVPQDPMKLTLNGETLILNPGFTFVNIVPQDLPITVTP